MSVDLTFDQYGNAANPAVVLIHPFPFRAAFWRSVAPAIAEAGYFVIAPNLRGCADSPTDDAEPDIDLLATDIWQVLAKLNVTNCFVLGVSLGGYVTLAMLRTHPERLQGIGLIDTKVTADSPAAVRNRQRIAHEILSELSTTEYAGQMLTTLLSEFTHSNRPEVVAQVRDWISASKPTTIAWLQQAMAGRPDSSNALAAFTGKTLLIRGAQDVVSKAEDFDLMRQLAQNATFTEIQTCGHLPPVEDADSTIKVITDWLRN